MGSENQRVYNQWSHIIQRKLSIDVEGEPGALEPEIWKTTQGPLLPMLLSRSHVLRVQENPTQTSINTKKKMGIQRHHKSKEKIR